MSFGTVLIALVMFVALIGMIICSKKQKSSPAAQPIAIGLLVIVIVCGVAVLYNTGIFGNQTNKFQEYENRYYASQGNVIGRFIAANYSGKKVLVILEPDYQKSPRTEIMTNAIKLGAGAGTEVVADTVIPAKAPVNPEEGMDMPLVEIMTAADFDAALDKHPDAGVIVSAVGLPRDARKMKLWNKKDRPGVILLNAVDMRGYDSLIKSDMIAAIVAIGPDAKFTEDAPPKDPQEAFKVRYILIDKSNVEQHGGMFQ